MWSDLIGQISGNNTIQNITNSTYVANQMIQYNTCFSTSVLTSVSITSSLLIPSKYCLDFAVTLERDVATAASNRTHQHQGIYYNSIM